MDAINLSQLLWPDAAQGRQPQRIPQIDWSNPITDKLLFAATPYGDAVSGKLPVLSGSSSYSVGLAGKAFKSPATQIPGAWTFSVDIPAAFSITVVCLFRCTTANNVTVAVPTLHFASGSEPVIFSSSGSQSAFRTAGNSSPAITTLTAGKVYSLAGVKRVASQEQYVDGELQTTSVTGNRTVEVITTVSVGRPANGNNLQNGEYFQVLYFGRALSANELKSLSDSPWQIFAPPSIPLFSTTGGGTEYTITPTGSIAFINGATYTKTKVVTPMGNISYAGSAALIYNAGSTVYTINPSGSIIYNNSAVYSKTKVLSVSGLITYNGTARAQKIRCIIPQGDITYSGSAIRVRVSTIIVNGSIVYSGTAPLYMPGYGPPPTTKLPLTGTGI